MTASNLATLQDYLAMIRRRKWLIVVVAVLIPALAVAYSLRQKPVYSASASVLLSSQNLAALLTGTQVQTSAATDAQTQSELARVPAVVNRVIRRFHLPMSVGGFLALSSVTASTDANILTFTVINSSAALAPKLATAYAQAYVAYRRGLDTASLVSAADEVGAQLEQLRRSHQSSGALYASLFEKEQQLRTLEALQTSNASVVDSPTGAAQVSSHTKRNAVLGVVLGIMLGIGLAYLREVFDTRVRSASEVTERLGLPLLGRLAAPPREVAARNELVTLADPVGMHAEAFRMIRNNLEIVSVDQDVRSLLVTSAVEGEGKTTTAANLAVTLARGGKRVALVDVDLRRPAVWKFFDLTRSSGLTQVVVGHATIDDALVPVPFSPSASNGRGPSTGRSIPWTAMGSLHVLGTGPLPPDPGEFIRTKSLRDVLAKIVERYDIVVLDAPPLLHVGDAIVLGALADAIALVTRLDQVRRPMLHEVRTLLAPMPTTKLGFIITGAEIDTAYGYGYGSSYYHRQHAAEVEPARAI